MRKNKSSRWGNCCYIQKIRLHLGRITKKLLWINLLSLFFLTKIWNHLRKTRGVTITVLIFHRTSFPLRLLLNCLLLLLHRLLRLLLLLSWWNILWAIIIEKKSKRIVDKRSVISRYRFMSFSISKERSWLFWGKIKKTNRLWGITNRVIF